MKQTSSLALLMAALAACGALSTVAACNAIDSSKLDPASPIADGGVRPGPTDDGGVDARVPIGEGGVPVQQDCSGSGELDTCKRDNALTTCVEGECLVVDCLDGMFDCNDDPDDGCEATLDSLDNCGLCGAACELQNAQTQCTDRVCGFAQCQAGFGDCDDNTGNGCERNLRTIEDCGTCGEGCDPVANGVPGCSTGTCAVGSCIGPFGDCDEDVDNGCEEPLASNTHCGACGKECEPFSAVGDCGSGVCVVESCTDERVDCNGLPLDGCEAGLDSSAHCGRCGASCELPHTLTTRCDTSSGASCVVDHACASEAVSCVDGALENGCEEGYGDCNEDAADGCEARLDSLTHCGGCGEPCVIENAITSCESGSCELVECEPGFAQCDDDSCQSLANDADNCGECGRECEGDTPNCYGGECTSATCPANTADCDDDGDCEAIDTTSACGLCDVSCGPFDHAGAACTAGRCTISTCDPGFDDCDDAVHNGCEVDIRTLDTCGSCTTSCVIPGAQESCATGTCTLVECDANRDDCNDDQADGCEVNIALPDNCGACGLDCRNLDNVLSGGCAEMDCSIICEAGFADCDGNPATGCEEDLGAIDTCRSCNVDCTALPNVASATCGTSGCDDLACDVGWKDCDGLTSNGCERNIRTLTDCGDCNTPCAPDHAVGTCSAGTCQVDDCDPGFDDCNDSAGDGCEASLSDPDTCGSCGNECSEGWACNNGACQCTSDEQCTGAGETCCNGTCTDTNNVCSWWPCPIASTNRPTLHCDACNNDCRFVGAQWCCGL
jgi:hypothetical protein